MNATGIHNKNIRLDAVKSAFHVHLINIFHLHISRFLFSVQHCEYK